MSATYRELAQLLFKHSFVISRGCQFRRHICVWTDFFKATRFEYVVCKWLNSRSSTSVRYCNQIVVSTQKNYVLMTFSSTWPWQRMAHRIPTTIINYLKPFTYFVLYYFWYEFRIRSNNYTLSRDASSTYITSSTLVDYSWKFTMVLPSFVNIGPPV